MNLILQKPYSPIELISFKAWEQAGIEVYFKREDLSHPFISGNKWRKLHYHLLTAASSNASTLVTFGGAYSNHLLATAAAGAKYGFKTLGIVRGEPVKNMVLGLCKHFGMQLLFIDRARYKDHFAFEQSNPIENAYWIPEGGGGHLGEMGIGELLTEIDPKYTHLCCSVGTGASFSGLLRKAAESNSSIQLEGFAVIKGGEYLSEDFQKQNYQHYTYYTHSHGGGYAKTSPELIAFIEKFSRETGILCDQVYEGKMLYYLNEMIVNGVHAKGSKIVILHNGGLSGMLSLFA
jgi:1-aminocyclopropane-1-carboxylate deaminase